MRKVLRQLGSTTNVFCLLRLCLGPNRQIGSTWLVLREVHIAGLLLFFFFRRLGRRLLFIDVLLYISLSSLLHCLHIFIVAILHAQTAFDGHFASSAHLLDSFLLLFLLLVIINCSDRHNYLIGCLTLLERVRRLLLDVVELLVLGEVLFRFVGGCLAHIDRIVLLFYLENGVPLGFRCRILWVVFFVNLVDDCGFLSHEGRLQLLRLLEHCF